MLPYFRERKKGERRMGKAVTDIALDRKLEQFVRETAQNSADAALDGETPHLVYRYVVIDEHLDDFKDAIGWEDLKPNLEAVAETDDDIGVQSMLDRIESGSLPLLIVEDRNASGLAGGEFSKDTNYASLLQDFGSSTKDEDEGGVHGVGASVLWGFSGFKTALFLSNPVSWDDDEAPRLIGRVDLPYHEVEATGAGTGTTTRELQGDGWLGKHQDSSQRPVSFRGDEAEELVEGELHIDALDDRAESPGTSAVVVGFREPSRTNRSPEKVIDRIEELAAKYYWPLMIEGGLTVSVQAPDDELREVTPSEIEWLTPFVEAYEKRMSADDELEDAPDVGATDVDLEIPGGSSGSSTTDGRVRVAVRTSDGDYEKYTNQIAMFRGARHVVKYRQYGHTARTAGQEFHGVLVAGRACYEPDVSEDAIDDADIVAEDFFRKAEPEAHDTWEDEVSKLESSYPGGNDAITTLIKDSVHDSLLDMLSDAGSDDTESMNAVGRQFPYFSGGPGRSGSSSSSTGGASVSVVDSIARNLTHPDDRFECNGTIELNRPAAGSWTLEIDEIGIVDNGGNQTGTVAVDHVSVTTPADEEPATSSGTRVDIPGGVEAVDFELASVPTDDYPGVGSGTARLQVELDVELEDDS